MDKNNNGSSDIPTDALVEILVRLPPNARRRFRLVCRHWRELIDQRTVTDMQSRTKIIAAAKGSTSVVDLLKPGSPRGQLWQTADSYTAWGYNKISIVGTCNGLVCLCNDDKPGGAITVANPSTGETLRLPPLPMLRASVHRLNSSGPRSWHQTYGFGYHHGTGQYKVVHVPSQFDSHFDRSYWQPIVHVFVFTLGEASWRDVHTTYARCNLGNSCIANVDDTMYWLTDLGISCIANVDDTMYWLTKEAGKIMSFDLKHELVTCTQPLPIHEMPSTYCLVKVHGRLGVAVGNDDDDSVTVWVLEGERWSRRYILELQQEEKWMMRRELVVPHSVHGDYFLTLTRESWSGFFVLYRHKLSELSRSLDGVARIRQKDRGEEVTSFPFCIHQIFSYVETKESLSAYGKVLVHNWW